MKENVKFTFFGSLGQKVKIWRVGKFGICLDKLVHTLESINI